MFACSLFRLKRERERERDGEEGSIRGELCQTFCRDCNGDCSLFNAANNLVSGRDILLRRSSQSFVVVIVVVVVVVVVVCVVVVAAVGFVRVGITCSRLRLLAWRKRLIFLLGRRKKVLCKRLNRFSQTFRR